KKPYRGGGWVEAIGQTSPVLHRFLFGEEVARLLDRCRRVMRAGKACRAAITAALHACRVTSRSFIAQGMIFCALRFGQLARWIVRIMCRWRPVLASHSIRTATS